MSIGNYTFDPHDRNDWSTAASGTDGIGYRAQRVVIGADISGTMVAPTVVLAAKDTGGVTRELLATHDDQNSGNYTLKVDTEITAYISGATWVVTNVKVGSQDQTSGTLRYLNVKDDGTLYNHDTFTSAAMKFELEELSSSAIYELRNLSSSFKFETEEFSGSTIYELRNISSSFKFETEEFSGSTIYELRNISSSFKFETEEFSGSTIYELRNISSSMKHELEEFSGSNIYELRNLSSSFKFELEEFSGSNIYELRNISSSLKYELEEFSGSNIYELRNISSSFKFEIEEFSGSTIYELRNISSSIVPLNRHDVAHTNSGSAVMLYYTASMPSVGDRNAVMQRGTSDGAAFVAEQYYLNRSDEVTVYVAPHSSVSSGTAVIAVAGTAVQLTATSTEAKKIVLSAYDTNIAHICVGGSGVGPVRAAVMLMPGSIREEDIDNVSSLYLNGMKVGDGLTWFVKNN